MCFHKGRIFLRKGKKDLEAMKIFMNEENEMNVLRFFKKKTRTKMCFIKGGFFTPKTAETWENKNNEKKKFMNEEK